MHKIINKSSLDYLQKNFEYPSYLPRQDKDLSYLELLICWRLGI